MKIYIVHIDALNEEQNFNDLSNDEIEKMYKDGNQYITCYYSIKALCDDWNAGWIFNPDFSYMRVIV